MMFKILILMWGAYQLGMHVEFKGYFKEDRE